jgi:cytochrome b6-f complex iron-sulfur subunit
MERKDFIRQLVIRGSAAVLLPSVILQSCEKDDSTEDPMNPGGNDTDIILNLDDPKYADLLTEGGSYLLTDKDIIVINKGNDVFVALSAICTHQGCEVGYEPASDTLPCPCHGSVFRSDGSVLNGPATLPLKVYPANLDANNLVIDV